MHYFQWNIGDYASHTGHLTPIEDLAYRRLLEAYYLREKALPEDVQAIARLVRLREHVAEIQTVLDEFFVREAGVGYTHARADQEIAKTGRQRETASRAGKASAAKRAAERQGDPDPTTVERESNDRSTTVERPLNAEATTVQPHSTQNTLPITQDPEVPPAPTGGGDPPGLDRFDEFWTAFAHKQNRPAAERAWKALKPKPPQKRPELLAIVIERARAYAKATPDKQFRKHPATWLRARGWEDELVPQAAATGPPRPQSFDDIDYRKGGPFEQNL